MKEAQSISARHKKDNAIKAEITVDHLYHQERYEPKMLPAIGEKITKLESGGIVQQDGMNSHPGRHKREISIGY